MQKTSPFQLGRVTNTYIGGLLHHTPALTLQILPLSSPISPAPCRHKSSGSRSLPFLTLRRPCARSPPPLSLFNKTSRFHNFNTPTWDNILLRAQTLLSLPAWTQHLQKSSQRLHQTEADPTCRVPTLLGTSLQQLRHRRPLHPLPPFLAHIHWAKRLAIF